MKIMIISPKNKTLFNFRGDLIREIVNMGHTVVAIGPNQDYMNDVLELGTQFIEVPLIKDNMSIFGDLDYYFKLKRVILNEKPDLIFSYTIKPVVYGSLAARKMRVKNIYPMVTGLGRVYSSNNLKSKLLKMITGRLYKNAFKGCNQVIFQNDDDLMQFVDLNYLPESKAVKVHGSGVNMEKFSLSNLPKQNTFLMISRVIREKGVFEFAKAARIVKADFPNSRFILLGGYDKSIGAIKPEDLEPYIKEGSIEFPGEVKDVTPYIKEARVFVLPSYYREGLPRTILESMAMGRPIITTDWPGCRDAVKDGINGYLVKPKDFISLSEKIKSMINDPIKVEEMGRRSLEFCIEKYDVKLVNQQMLSIMKLIS